MRRWKAVAGLLLISAISSGIWWWRLPRGPNVLLITLDTTRADRIGCYGYQKAKTPLLDRLAAEGVRFDNALTAIPLTLPAHATMLTGLLPPEHGLRTNAMGSLPAQGIPTLAEHFLERGYRTGAFLGAFVLDKRFGLNRGFEKYDDDCRGDEPVDERNLARRRKADRVIDSALSWLLPSRRQPYFCWIHLYDAHNPRTEHAETFGKDFSGRPYDAELAFVDQQLANLVSTLGEQGMLEDTIVVVVGDHGESLGEHQEPEHAQQLYNATLRVPLVIHSPKRFAAGAKVATTVGLNDLLPTLADCLEWKNINIPTKAAGRSLRPALQGKTLDEVPHYSETWEPFYAMHCMPQFAVVSEGWKYIRSPQPELYQTSQDPNELTNLAEAKPERVAELSALLKDIESRFVSRTSEDIQKSAELDRLLTGLGYAKGNAKLASLDARTDLKDVKTLMRAFSLTHDALAESVRNPSGAIATLERVAGQWPQLHPPRAILASLLVSRANADSVEQGKRKQDLEQAESICREVILAEESWPEAEQGAEAHATLAAILADADRFDEADKEYERATKLRSYDANQFLNWARLLLRRNQTDKALEKLEIAVKTDEGLFTAQSQIGEILIGRAQKLSGSSRPEDRAEEKRLQTEALRHFELATRYNPQFLPAHYFAAGILMGSGQFDAAARHYSQIAVVDKKGANVRYLWALSLAQQQTPEKSKEAVQLLRQALNFDPRHAKARDLLRVYEEGQ